jgi:osmotically-inducible protein OsmY
MRRKYFGLAIAAFATFGPMQAWGGDREIAEQIIQRLKNNRDSGALKDFTLDMKVENGVVLFRGNVSQPAQKQVVLRAADGIVGISRVVDEVKVVAGSSQEAEAFATPSQEQAVVQAAGPSEDQFSFRQALAQADAMKPSAQIVPVSAAEPTSDAEVVAAVVAALSKAKEAGELRGFGVDVKSQNGILELTGRASSPQQRDAIIEIAESVPGVAGIREAIAIPTAAPNLPQLPEPPSLTEVGSLTPVAVDPVRHPVRRGTPAGVAAQPVAMTTPYRMQQGVGARMASNGVCPPGMSNGGMVGGMNGGINGGMVSGMNGGMAPVAGQPVPMAPHSAVGAPRYDTPNLPNYAWPGYAAYPNYAAVTYPQQYSPTAWPYIGPFYPYPQVPLGWRKVSLEWDDGWWFLDFSDTCQ